MILQAVSSRPKSFSSPGATLQAGDDFTLTYSRPTNWSDAKKHSRGTKALVLAVLPPHVRTRRIWALLLLPGRAAQSMRWTSVNCGWTRAYIEPA